LAPRVTPPWRDAEPFNAPLPEPLPESERVVVGVVDGEFDAKKWNDYRKVFATHVVED